MFRPASTILVVGGDGLVDEVQKAGFAVTRSADDDPAAVIQGFAPEIGWAELAEASFALQGRTDERAALDRDEHGLDHPGRPRYRARQRHAGLGRAHRGRPTSARRGQAGEWRSSTRRSRVSARRSRSSSAIGWTPTSSVRTAPASTRVLGAHRHRPRQAAARGRRGLAAHVHPARPSRARRAVPGGAHGTRTAPSASGKRPCAIEGNDVRIVSRGTPTRSTCCAPRAPRSGTPAARSTGSRFRSGSTAETARSGVRARRRARRCDSSAGPGRATTRAVGVGAERVEPRASTPSGGRPGCCRSRGGAARRRRRCTNIATVPSPQSNSSSGRAAARYAPIAIPTEVSMRAGDDDRQAGLGDDPQGGVHAAERLRLHDQQVGRAGPRDGQRVGSPCARSRRRRSGCPCSGCGAGSRPARRRSRTAARRTRGRTVRARGWRARPRRRSTARSRRHACGPRARAPRAPRGRGRHRRRGSGRARRPSPWRCGRRGSGRGPRPRRARGRPEPWR